MKVKCLVLDHDDTVVASSATIHYPCFVEYLKDRKPELMGRWSFEDFMRSNFSPGVLEFFEHEVGLSQQEMAEEETYWTDFVARFIPDAYEGMRELLSDFRRAGGIIAVTSHSFSHYIRRDYEHNALPMPDDIYGWELDREKRKPRPFALYDLMAKYGLSPDEMLVVDDLKPGLDMAHAAGVPFAAVGWAYRVPELESYMKENAEFYLDTVKDLRTLLGL